MKKPLIIEVAGPPESGKTTTCKLLKESFESKGQKVLVVQEAASQAPFMPAFKMSYKFNLWTLGKQLTSLIEASVANVDIILFDRGLFDSKCWFLFFRELNQFTQRDLNLMHDFLSIGYLNDAIDVTVLLTCSVDESILRKGGEGSIVNKSILTLLGNAYSRLRDEADCQIDTSRLPPYNVSGAVENFLYKKKILTMIEK